MQRHLLSVPFVSGVAAAAGLLLTAIVVVCAAYHRKSRQSDRAMRKMQCQMDGLEARVAKECKEGAYVSYPREQVGQVSLLCFGH